MNASILYMCLLACLHMHLHVQYVSIHLHIESNIGMCDYGCVSGMRVTLHYCLSVYEYMTLCVCERVFVYECVSVRANRCLPSPESQPGSSHQYSPGFLHAEC